MKQLIFISIAIAALYSCSKDQSATPINTNSNNSAHSNYIVLSIGQQYAGWSPNIKTDSLLPTSYWKSNTTQRNIPLLALIYYPSGTQSFPGYPGFRDTLDVISGDIIEAHFDLKHRWDDSLYLEAGGIFVTIMKPGTAGSLLGRFVCEGDTLSQTITYTVY